MKARDDNPALHHIVVERDEDGALVSVRFVCDGDDAAPCHQWPDCGCEQWGGAHGDPKNGISPEPGHEDVSQAHCWIQPWFNDTTDGPEEFAELYEGDDFDFHELGDLDQLVSGPVETTFEGDYMTWEYAS